MFNMFNSLLDNQNNIIEFQGCLEAISLYFDEHINCVGFPKGFEAFFIEKNITEFFFTFLLNPPNPETLLRALKICNHIHSISANCDYLIIPKSFRKKNFLENVLLVIRDSLDSSQIPFYLHLMANIAFFKRKHRDQILLAFPPKLLDDMMCQCNDPEKIQIVHETGFFVMRMTSYKLDMSIFENFPKWLDHFFYSKVDLLDDLTIYYFIRAFNNLIYFSCIDINHLVKKGYSSVIENIFQRDMKLTDNTIFNLLKMLKKLIMFGGKLTGFDVDLIFRLGMAGMETSSPYVFKILEKIIIHEDSILRLLPTDNGLFPDEILPAILMAFSDMNFEMKMAVLGFLKALMRTSEAHQTYVLGKKIFSFLLQALWETDDTNLVSSILMSVEDILMLGQINGADNIFSPAMYEFNAIEYLQTTLVNAEDERIAAQAKGILDEYFPESMIAYAGDEIYDDDDDDDDV